MKSFNPQFYTKKVQDYLTDLIHAYGYGDYNDLMFDQKCELAALIIDAYPASDIHECFVESNAISNMAAIMVSLKNHRESSREVLEETIHKNIVRYFDSSMEAMFERCLADYAEEYARSAGNEEYDPEMDNSAYKPYHYRERQLWSEIS